MRAAAVFLYRLLYGMVYVSTYVVVRGRVEDEERRRWRWCGAEHVCRCTRCICMMISAWTRRLCRGRASPLSLFVASCPPRLALLHNSKSISQFLLFSAVKFPLFFCPFGTVSFFSAPELCRGLFQCNDISIQFHSAKRATTAAFVFNSLLLAACNNGRPTPHLLPRTHRTTSSVQNQSTIAIFI